jgi:NTE family protein
MNEQAPSKASHTNRPLRALVLSGGGARGAYEIGVLKALSEAKVHFDIAFGTSIGGINATFLAQGKLDRLEELWCSIRATDIFRLPTIDQFKHLLIGLRWGLLDTSPLESLLYREIDLDLFKASRTKVGLLTTDLCTLETKLITSDDITSVHQLVDTLMASSALPILFPARHLDGEGFWVDAGLVRNTPIQAAINMGAKEIHIVLLQAEGDTACPTNIVQVLTRISDILLYASARDGITMIRHYNSALKTISADVAKEERLTMKVFQPANRVNFTLLDINPAQSKLLIAQGYEEAMRALADFDD